MKFKQLLSMAAFSFLSALFANAETPVNIAQAAQIATLQAQVAALQKQVAAINSSSVMAMKPFVKVDLNAENGVVGPHILFQGVNVHIVSGSGDTTDYNAPTGLGNLILGYDEAYQNGWLTTGARGGIHNLIIGRYHKFTRGSVASLVCGEENTTNGYEEALLGGVNNSANNSFSVIVGGDANTSNYGVGKYGSFANVIVGGILNVGSGYGSTILGGTGNVQNADYKVLVGSELANPFPE